MEYGRTHYLRIPKNKFWAWVIVSLCVGLAIGLGIMFARQISLNRQIDAAKKQAETQVAEANAQVASMQKRLTSTEASLAVTTEQINQLKTQQAKSQTSATSNSSSSDNTLTVVSRTITPSSVTTGGAIVMTAKVKGGPDKVTMRVTGPNGFDQSYSLSKSSTSGTTQTWKKSTSAPKKPGTYKYFATAYLGTKSATMPGASPSTFTVK